MTTDGSYQQLAGLNGASPNFGITESQVRVESRNQRRWRIHWKFLTLLMDSSPLPPILIKTDWDDQAVENLVNEAIASGHTRVKRSHMKLGPYNGFSGELRVEVDWKIKIAVEQKLIPEARDVGCTVCGTKYGRVDYHNEDYGHAFRTVAICMKCHMALHNRFRSSGYAASWNKRVKEHGDGTKWFEKIPTACDFEFIR